MASDLLTRELIETYLREVADILGDYGKPQVVVVVGGALLAHYDLRDATRDVDSVRRLSDELKDAVAEVAKRHDLAPEWMNANAVSWRPQTLNEEDCEIMLEHGRLRVLGAPIDQVFLMKLESSRVADRPDLVRAWPHTSFKTAEEVIEAFEQAYPAALEDAHLVSYVEEIIKQGG